MEHGIALKMGIFWVLKWDLKDISYRSLSTATAFNDLLGRLALIVKLPVSFRVIVR